MSPMSISAIVGSAMLAISLVGQAPAQSKPAADPGTPVTGPGRIAGRE